ncbi:MAG: hypothetical protein AB7F86_18975 [Bdellovibrionales bacterium]
MAITKKWPGFGRFFWPIGMGLCLALVLGSPSGRAQAPSSMMIAQLDDSELDEEDDFTPGLEQEMQEADRPGQLQPESSNTAGTLDPPQDSPNQRRTSLPGETGGVIFDWTRYQNAKQVPHPFAEKGLLKIDKSRNYIYKVPESEQKTAASLRVGTYTPSNLEAKRDDGTTVTFTDTYDKADNPSIYFDWEWQLWKSPIGKWGIQTGLGVYQAQGNGRFKGTVNAGLTPREVFTFVVMPLNLGAIYRLSWGRRQMFVPYGVAGGTAFAFGEFRDDNEGPKFGGSLGAYYGGGVALSLTYFDKYSRLQLDSEYGINDVFLNLEYRGYVALMQNFDFSGDMVAGGLTMEF